MKLYIKQKWNKYFIYAEKNEQPISEGYWKNKRKIGLHCKLFDVDKNEKLFVRIGKSDSKWWWIGPPRLYILEFPDQKISVDIKLVNIWRGHFSFDFKKIKYDFYSHYGHKKSLYKEDRQVAKFDKAVFNWGERDSGFIISNSNENQYLLLGLFLMTDMGERNGAEVSWDFGNLTKGVKDWNEYWLPEK